MKKKIIIGVSAAVIVIAAIAAGVIMGVSSKKKSSNDINVSCKAVVTKNDDITCYDWLKKLCNKMGIEVEDYRKAAKENGYITDSDEFSDGDIASGGFMALTSMRAMGEGKMQIYLGTDDEISDNTNIELAIDKDLIAEDSLDKGFSDEEADGILDKFDDLYYGEFWPDNIENVSYKENISQLEYFDIKDYKEDDNIITLDDSAARNLKKGDTFVFDYKGDKGNIVHWWSDELSKEEADIVNPFRPERFEGAFFEIPFCYKSAGTPVKDIVDGTYGILSFGEDDWNDYLQEIKDRKWEVDYSDIQAVVLYPIKSEYWDHMHCNPLHLQMELPPHMENKEEDAAYRRAMEALSDYCFYKGEHNTEETAKRCMREYAKVCRK